MNINDFDYDLPESFIAQEPVEPRDSSKLMVVDRTTGSIEHRVFRDIIEYLNPGDVLVYNETRVIPARLIGRKAATNGRAEILLLRQINSTRWLALVGGRRMEAGVIIRFDSFPLTAEIVEKLDEAERIVEFSQPINSLLPQIGQTPLPPYIHKTLKDSERYQTIYSRVEGSAAAPTAGLHFTHELMKTLRDKGVITTSCLLHIGLDTFQPVKVERIESHHMHSERAYLSEEAARIINHARLTGHRIIAVGTTTARTLETAAVLSAGGIPAQAVDAPPTPTDRPVIPFERDTDLYIYPGYQWRAVDGLITNFHLPKSTLLMMISAFCSREIALNAYELAKQHHYRFFSFGDAMFITLGRDR